MACAIGVGLARAGDAEQDLVGLAVVDGLRRARRWRWAGRRRAGIGVDQLERDAAFGLFARRAGRWGFQAVLPSTSLRPWRMMSSRALHGGRDADGLRAGRGSGRGGRLSCGREVPGVLTLPVAAVSAAPASASRICAMTAGSLAAAREMSRAVRRRRVVPDGTWPKPACSGSLDAGEAEAVDGVGLRLRRLERHAGGGGAVGLLGLLRLLLRRAGPRPSRRRSAPLGCRCRRLRRRGGRRCRGRACCAGAPARAAC